MFDLFRSREKSVRILLGGLLVVVALSMLTYLVPSYNTGATASDLVVATVGNDTITQQDVQRVVQTTMRGRQLPPDLVPTYLPSLIDQMVTERALAYQAEKLGFRVSDDDVRNAIQQTIPNLFPDGKFVGKDTYAAMLAQENLTIPQFEADLRRQILINRLRGVALEGTIVTNDEIARSYQERNEKAKLQWVKLTGDKYKNEIQPTVEDMQTYFKANQARYQEPPKKNLVLLIADQAKITESLNPTDADLQKLYNQSQEQYRVPERVEARHILLKTQGKPASDDPKIKAQAEDIVKQIRAGGNFADLAKKYSEDPGSAVKGGDLGWIQRGQTVPDFEKTAFALKPSETSGLVKTEYGYHIIQVSAHENAHLQPFDQVKAQLATEWKNARVNQAMQQISDRVQTALQNDTAHPEKVAAEFGMQMTRADGVAAGKPAPEIGTNADFDQSIADVPAGKVSQPVALPGNKLALALVTAVTPARPSTFDEAKDQIRDAIVQARLTTAVQQHAKELADKAQAAGGDLAKAAKSMGLEVKTSEEFTRTANVDGVGPASYVQDAFSKPEGTLIGPIGVPDGTVVAKVAAKVPADPSQLAVQRSTIRDELKSQKARDRNTLFEAGVRDEMKRQGKLKYHQDVINRIVAQYRSS
jgi:peptidyl-prolyl cis-trans isomerase D